MNTLVLVAKYPTPGTSKTRLIPALGEDGAATLARAMLLDLLEQLGASPELADTRKVLAFAPKRLVLTLRLCLKLITLTKSGNQSQ